MKTVLGMAGILALSVSAFAAGIPAHNSISGNYVEARTADVYTGPCFANSETGLTGELAVLGWKVTKGSWEGVNLDGLSVVGVIRAKSTLGDVYSGSNPAKAVLIVDASADPEQRLALRNFAQHMGGDLLQDVVRVDYAPVNLSFANGDMHSMKATLKAGDLAEIKTRAMVETDQICHNEVTWYPPLTALNHSMPAYTLANSYQGDALGTRWNNPDKRSSFIGTFSE